jgi:hypothetical protein
MGRQWASRSCSLEQVLRGKVLGFSRKSCLKSQHYLLQALHMQGKPREADEELQKLVCMHATFSSKPNSAEMELVARGLSYLGAEERRELLIRYTAVGGSQTESIAREALGLQLTMDRS